MILEGCAARFQALTSEPFSPWKKFDFLEYRARLAPECFTSCLRYEDREIKALYSHQDSEIYARRTDGTLKLDVDHRGLHFTMEVDDIAHPHLSEIVPRIRGVSIGFNCLKARTELVRGEKVWTIFEAWLHEISLAENPRWPQTSCRIIRPANVSLLRQRFELETAL
jgi:HK97 family phage prohead protease